MHNYMNVVPFTQLYFGLPETQVFYPAAIEYISNIIHHMDAQLFYITKDDSMNECMNIHLPSTWFLLIYNSSSHLNHTIIIVSQLYHHHISTI
jgi:hypothetical protein